MKILVLVCVSTCLLCAEMLCCCEMMTNREDINTININLPFEIPNITTTTTTTMTALFSAPTASKQASSSSFRTPSSASLRNDAAGQAPHSARTSISSIRSVVSSSHRSSVESPPNLEEGTEDKLVRVVAHFDRDKEIIPVSQEEAKLDKGYLRGWAGGFGAGAGKKRKLKTTEKFWLVSLIELRCEEATLDNEGADISCFLNTCAT